MTWILISSAIITTFFLPAHTNLCQINAWWYVHDSKIVYICEWLRDQDFIMTHEYAHYVWYNFLSQKEKNAYIKQWKISKGIPNSFDRDYSATNAEEWFADDVMYLLNTPDYLQYSHLQRKQRILLVQRIIKKFNFKI